MSLYGGITLGDALKVLVRVPLYMTIGGLTLVVAALVVTIEWAAKSTIWDKQIIRCGTPKD